MRNGDNDDSARLFAIDDAKWVSLHDTEPAFRPRYGKPPRAFNDLRNRDVDL
jgi:hypothetical protein